MNEATEIADPTPVASTPVIEHPFVYRVNFAGPNKTQRVMFGRSHWAYADFGTIQNLAKNRAIELGWSDLNIVSIQLCEPDVATF